MLITILHTLNFIKIYQLVECSQDIKCKKNSDTNQNNEYLHFVNINAFTKFYQNPSTGPQDTEHKQNFNINQGP